MENDYEERFAELVGQLDGEGMLLVLLLMHALKRKDMKLSAALEAYSQIPRQDQDDMACDIDLELLGQIRAVCPADEGLVWGRALTQCVLRGDQRKASAFQDLMRRRVAN